MMKRAVCLLMLMMILLGTSPPVFAAKFSLGDTVQVINCTVVGMPLRVRSSPSLSGGIIGSKNDGDRGMILTGPQSADGYNWWKVRWPDNLEGWSAEGDASDYYLTKVTIPPSTKFSIGDPVTVYGTGAYGLNVRNDPPYLTDTGTNVYDGKTGTVIGGPFYGIAISTYTPGFYHFWKINYGTITGWSAQEWLVEVPTYDADIYAHCNTDGAGVGVAISMDGSPTGYVTPHRFTGLTGTHNFAVPGVDGSGHPFKNWNTGLASTTIPVSSTGTYTAYYQATVVPKTLSVYSSPSGVSFTANGVSHATPWSEAYAKDTLVSLMMPSDYSTGDSRYNWYQWNDGEASRFRTVTLSSDTIVTGSYIGPYYKLTIASSPTSGIPFTLDGVTKTTSYSEWLYQGYYNVEMPATYNGQAWQRWMEDGNTNRMRTVLLTHSTTLTAVYSVPPTLDFSISAFPTLLSIQQGSSRTSTITITSINGFNQPVQLSVSGAPSGVTATLSPSQVTPPAGGTATSALTVSVATTATPGSYTLTVTGTSGALTHSTYISLEVTSTPPPPNQPPNVPTFVFQFKTDSTQIPVGETTVENTVVFKGVVSDPDGDRVRFQVELRNLHENEGQFNEAAGGFKDGEPVSSGNEAVAFANELIDESYHWRARAVDEHGLNSSWAEFGNNLVSEADFIVQTSSIEWTFAIITDLHIGRGYPNYNGESYYLTERLQKAVDWIKNNRDSRAIRFVVVLGDISENGRQSEMSKAREILNHLNEANIPYFPVLGNHDVKQLMDGGYVFQDTFTDDFLKDQCKMLNVVLDLNWRIWELESGTYYQNYDFKYNDKRFVFLDWVDRNGMVGSPLYYEQTADFLRNQLGNGDPTFLFSHHPMIDDYIEGAFWNDDINSIAGIIRETNSKDLILGSYGGHIHSYFDPEKGWNQDTPPENPMFLNTRNILYPSGISPEGIRVYGTEALMSASYDPTSTSRNVTRIVTVRQDTIATYVDCEYPSLNPYVYDWTYIPDIWHHRATCYFTLYAFSIPGTHPITYSIYLNNILIDSISSSESLPVTTADHVVARGTYTLKLVVEGYARDGKIFSESINRTLTVDWFGAVVLSCPVDVIVTDPLGNSVGKSINEIPGATYSEADVDEDGDFEKFILIPTETDGDYLITLNGTATGVYCMIAEFATAEGVVNFAATEIPISLGATHNFTVDWAALSRGEEGVTVQVDSNGDGVAERTFTSDNELTREEFQGTIEGDITQDGVVDIFDLVTVVIAFGSTPSIPSWDARCDLNGDSVIDVLDLAIVAINFGKESTPP